jgi:hypothetical protein
MAVSSAFPDSPPFASSQSPSRASRINENDAFDVAEVSIGDVEKLEEAQSGELPYASLPSASTSSYDEIDRGLAHGSSTDTKLLEHAPPSESMHSRGSRILEEPPVAFAINHDVTRGAFPMAPSGDTSTRWSFRSPIASYDATREFTNEESKEEENVSNMAAESALYTVEAERVPDGNEEETIMVAKAEYVRRKWNQRRWICLGLALFACGLIVAVVVLVVRPQSATSRSSLTSTNTATVKPPPSSKPTSLTPEQIACNFLSEPDVSECRSTVVFGGATTGSTIPSEIGLLTQLTFLSFHNNSLTSTIPSEIGQLRYLASLSFSSNSLTSKIPSELTSLSFYC